MPKPKLLGVEYGPEAKRVREEWLRLASGAGDPSRMAKTKIKSLATFEHRARANPLAAGHPIAHHRWPRDIEADYGPDIPNLFRFELANRWRGYYTLVGEPGGARIFVLYLLSHEEYNEQSGYAKL